MTLRSVSTHRGPDSYPLHNHQFQKEHPFYDVAVFRSDVFCKQEMYGEKSISTWEFRERSHLVWDLPPPLPFANIEMKKDQMYIELKIFDAIYRKWFGYLLNLYAFSQKHLVVLFLLKIHLSSVASFLLKQECDVVHSLGDICATATGVPDGRGQERKALFRSRSQTGVCLETSDQGGWRELEAALLWRRKREATAAHLAWTRKRKLQARTRDSHEASLW